MSVWRMAGRLHRLTAVGWLTGNWLWWAAAGALCLALCRRPLGALCRLTVRSGLGLVFLWLFQGVGALIGIHLGVNLFNSLVLGALGAPGFALLLLTQCIV